MAWGRLLCRSFLVAGLFAAAAWAADLPSPPVHVRAEVPDEAQAQQARRALEEICAASSSARDPAALARELLTKAQRQTEDLTYLFVLLEKARILSLRAGDGPIALRATRLAAETFNLDVHALYRDTLQQLSTKETPPPLVVHQSIRQSLLAMEEERYDYAGSFAEIAQRVARRARDPRLIQQADAAAFDARRGRELVATFSRPGASTQVSTMSPQARYLLFYRRDREAGLPMLATSNDPLAALADQERHLQADPEAIASCAAEWWSIATKLPELPLWRVRRHASDLYARAMPRLGGVKRDLVEKRIGDARMDQLAAQGYASGVVLEVIRDADPGRPPVRSICADVTLPADDLPRSDYTLRCSGLIDAPIEGAYELLFVAGTGAKLTIDGKVLVDDPAFYRKRAGETVSIQLSQGLHDLLAEIHVAGGKSKLQLTWRRPGQKDFSPIPVSALYHEDE